MRVAVLSFVVMFASAVHADPSPAVPVSVTPSPALAGASSPAASSAAPLLALPHERVSVRVPPTVPSAQVARTLEGGEAPKGASYPWLTGASAGRLDERFRDPPVGFVRVPLEAKSFGSFLRALPLQVDGAPVLDFRGNPLYQGGHHPNIAAVADLDVGNKDLQQCADAILRLNAEWRYGIGDRQIAYRTVSGKMMAYRGFMTGSRAVASGNDIVFKTVAAPHADDHALFRGWLDEVFAWAGTASLQHEGKAVDAISDVQPGDFFVMTGAPFGHAVLVLDVAKDDQGRRALLLGQSYIPAQTFQILKSNRTEGAWFVVEPSDAAVATPFWKPFPVGTLRRFS